MELTQKITSLLDGTDATTIKNQMEEMGIDTFLKTDAGIKDTAYRIICGFESQYTARQRVELTLGIATAL